MDLILGRWADLNLSVLSEPDLRGYEALLEEDDQDLYHWVSGQVPPPQEHAPLIDRIKAGLQLP